MIAIQTEDVDIGKLVNEAKQRGTGAVVVFDGIVRDDDITEMELEAYEEVAAQELEKIAGEAKKTYNLLLCRHHPPDRAACRRGEYPYHCRQRRAPQRGLRRLPVYHRER